MNHQEAENTKATERYLLREMTNEERMAFEDHYLDCAECLEAVTFGADFLDSGHELAEEKGVQQSVALPWYRRTFSALRPMLKPAPAIALNSRSCPGRIQRLSTEKNHKPAESDC